MMKMERAAEVKKEEHGKDYWIRVREEEWLSEMEVDVVVVTPNTNSQKTSTNKQKDVSVKNPIYYEKL